MLWPATLLIAASKKDGKRGGAVFVGITRLPPFTPFPPFPEFGHDDFWSGYNLGLLMAIQKAESE